MVVHPDEALPGIRWALEIDHVICHGGRIDARDKGRGRKLRRISGQVDRVTDVEMRSEFRATIDEHVDLVALRRRQLDA